ncbi:MAG: hypothetical protein M3Q07_16120 [Pseudobdellovibrionaceae bacterium]|nr:hypothetical protein [Pseudobdellovibrionaceae bacterium]
MVVDSEAPSVQGNPYANEQCEMSGVRGFRCRISEADVETAVLAPESAWPTSDYAVSTSSETANGNEQHWLNFKFQKDVPETPIDDILITDRIGNTNKDLLPNTISYDPTSARPGIVKATAFNNSILELEFSADVGSIEAVLVDGRPKEFEMTSVDNFQAKYKPANVVVHFSAPISDGNHKVEIKGASRIRNKAARTESLVLDDLDNRATDILQSSITQDPDLWRTTDLRFEVTRPFTVSLLAFAAESRTGSTLTIPFTDFTLTPEGLTRRGTYAFRLHKKTTTGLQPLEYTQGIVLQIPGRSATRKVYTTWSTEEPRFYLFGHAKPDGFIVNNLVQLDLDSLALEIVSKDEVISVDRSWISPYLSEDERDLGFKVTLPEGIRLKNGAFIYKVRVKAARTINFGIELTKPFESNLTVTQ